MRVAVRDRSSPCAEVLCVVVYCPAVLTLQQIKNAENCLISLRKRQSSISSREDVMDSLWLDSLAEHVLADEGDDLASMVLFGHDPSSDLISHSK